MSEGTDASEASQPAVRTMKKGRPRQISAGEKTILARLVPAFNAAATRSQERRDLLEDAVEALNKLRPENEWDVKRLRVWVMNHREPPKNMRKLGSSTGSLTSSFATGGVKRAMGSPEERFAKRSNSFSQFDSDPNRASKPLDTDKLSSFFQLEHSRLPRDPLLIFHVTSGDELTSQLSFNWLLEERIAGTCEVLEKIENRGPLVASDGSVVVASKIDPFVAVIGAAASTAAAGAPSLESLNGGSSEGGSGFVVSNTITPQPPALLLRPPPEENYGMLCYDEEDEEEEADDEDVYSDARRSLSPKHGGDMRDLVHMEPPRDEDSGGLEPMHLAEVGRAAALREGNATLVCAPCRFALGGAELTRGGKLVLASRRVEGAAVSVCEVARDGLFLKDAALPMSWLDAPGALEEAGGGVGSLAGSVVVDEARSTFWISAGKYVAGFDMNSVGRGPLCRLLPDRSHAMAGAPTPMVARKNFLCVGVGSWINVWDLEEVETTSSSDVSSMYESVSASEGDSSPPLGENPYLGTERFAKQLSKKFCRCCNQTLFDRGVEKRDCSECRTQVCSDCVHMYKLTSLGETGVRTICSTCIVAIRKRIQAQQSSRMPQLVERERAGSWCQRRDVAPHQQHEVVKRNNTYRSVGLMVGDYTDDDRLLLSFDKRQSALTWSLEHAQELRWFVGHTAAITALASCESQPTLLGTGSADYTAKIWDARVRAPTLTLRGHRGPVSAMCLVGFDKGDAFCFTGGLDEVIKVWDLRMQQPLYELSTGNTRPRYLAWNAGTSSLVCTAVTGYSAPTWPPQAVHAPEHFPKVFHCNSNAVLQYDFTSLL